MDDLDDLLGRVQPLEDIRTERLLLDRLDELPDDLEADVGLKQRDPDLAQCDLQVLLADLAPTPQLLEDGGQPIRQTLKHSRPLLLSPLITTTGRCRPAHRRNRPRRSPTYRPASRRSPRTGSARRPRASPRRRPRPWPCR